MSRQYNFMPSRYAIEVSRSERDTSVTVAGQTADNRRTESGVTRDAPVTHTPRPTGQKRDKPETDADREARALHRQEEYSHQKLVEGLGELRIMGRHIDPPAPPRDIAFWCEELRVPLDKGRAAYEAGRQDRIRGVRCMCASCNGQRVYEADAARMAYSTRRYRELSAQGVGLDEAARRIKNEISRGEHLER